VIDTLVLAGRNDDGGGLTRDDRCSRYGVNSLRSKHDALLDAKLLAAVYGEPTRTRQAVPQLEPITAGPSNIRAIVRPQPLPPRVTTGSQRASGVCAHARPRCGLAQLFRGTAYQELSSCRLR